jgi:hypothetical protein
MPFSNFSSCSPWSQTLNRNNWIHLFHRFYRHRPLALVRDKKQLGKMVHFCVLWVSCNYGFTVLLKTQMCSSYLHTRWGRGLRISGNFFLFWYWGCEKTNIRESLEFYFIAPLLTNTNTWGAPFVCISLKIDVVNHSFSYLIVITYIGLSLSHSHLCGSFYWKVFKKIIWNKWKW